MKIQKGESLEEKDFYIEKCPSYVYANLINSGMKAIFTKQVGSDIFRPLLASSCITRKLIITNIPIFISNIVWWESFHVLPF